MTAESSLRVKACKLDGAGFRKKKEKKGSPLILGIVLSLNSSPLRQGLSRATFALIRLLAVVYHPGKKKITAFVKTVVTLLLISCCLPAVFSLVIRCRGRVTSDVSKTSAQSHVVLSCCLLLWFQGSMFTCVGTFLALSSVFGALGLLHLQW